MSLSHANNLKMRHSPSRMLLWCGIMTYKVHPETTVYSYPKEKSRRCMKLTSDLRDNEHGLYLLLSRKWLRDLLCFLFWWMPLPPFSCSGSKPQSHHYISPLPHTPHPISWPILLILWPQRVWHLTPPVPPAWLWSWPWNWLPIFF